jgi:hypothetical protein
MSISVNSLLTLIYLICQRLQGRALIKKKLLIPLMQANSACIYCQTLTILIFNLINQYRQGNLSNLKEFYFGLSPPLILDNVSVSSKKF